MSDAGAARNTLLQLISQVATLAFTGGLTLYLVRALGARQYGVYALAVSVAGLALFPAGLGLPLAVGRFLADHRDNAAQLRQIFRTGMRMQVPAALVVGIGLFAASGAIAEAYGNPHLGWPLRWAALSVIGQALFAFLSSVGSSVRNSGLVLRLTIIESAVETATSIGFVVAGAGAAGATLGKFAGYTVVLVAGVYLAARLLGVTRSARREPALVSARALVRYAAAMLLVDITWSAITQLDVLLIGAVLSSAAVGSFGAVLRVLGVFGYVGLAVASGVAPRMSIANGQPDMPAFENGLRYLIIVQGLIVAPMLIWSAPIVHLLLGPGYHSAAAIMRTLTLYYFIGGPAALITVAVSYLGEARRRVSLMIATLGLGLIATYVLIRLVGVVGAALGDDLIQIVYVGGHLWICSQLVPIDLRSIARSAARTIVSAGAMALVLLAFGTDRLSPVQWVAGGIGGLLAFALALVATGEMPLGEMRHLGSAASRRVRGA